MVIFSVGLTVVILAVVVGVGILLVRLARQVFVLYRDAQDARVDDEMAEAWVEHATYLAKLDEAQRRLILVHSRVSAELADGDAEFSEALRRQLEELRAEIARLSANVDHFRAYLRGGR